MLIDVGADRPAPDSGGTYRWKYMTANGVERELQFNPGRNVVPLVESGVSRTGVDEYLYDYRIANAATASQSITLISVENVLVPTRSASTPGGWRAFEPGRGVPRVSWGKVFDPVTPGMLPGEIKAFQLVSPRLPGVTEFKFFGNNPLSAVETAVYPGPEIQDQINRLFVETVVVRRSLGPTIRNDADTPAELVRSVRRGYRHHVLASTHPAKSTIAEQLDQAVDAGNNVGDVKATLSRLADILSRPGVDNWDKELASGLLLCVEHLLRSPSARR